MPRFCSALLAFVGLFIGSCAAAQEPTQFQPHTFRGGKDAELKYQLLTPAAAAQPGDEKFPLVLFLHGAGERGSDNQAQLKHGTGNFATAALRQKYPCYVAAPQCRTGQWWNTQADLLLELIADLQKQHRIDPQRIYVTGLSMGGFGTWELISRKPELFAAAAPICGGGDPACSGLRQPADLGVSWCSGHCGQTRTLPRHGRGSEEGRWHAEVHRIPRRRT